MSENIDSLDLLGSGGHVWAWAAQSVTRKRVGSVAILGEYHQVTAIGARAGQVTGRNGGPAILKASDSTRALADTALSALEAAIEDIIAAGDEVEWEDDQGHSGTALILMAYRRSGPRQYSVGGSSVQAWQRYSLEYIELNGGF